MIYQIDNFLSHIIYTISLLLRKKIFQSFPSPLWVLKLILENLFSSRSVVFVHTKQRQDKIMKRIFELPSHGTPVSSPVEHVPLSPEEMLSVVSDVGEDSSQAPHISRGADVRVVSSQNLRGQIADPPTNLGGSVVHGAGSLA